MTRGDVGDLDGVVDIGDQRQSVGLDQPHPRAAPVARRHDMQLQPAVVGTLGLQEFLGTRRGQRQLAKDQAVEVAALGCPVRFAQGEGLLSRILVEHERDLLARLVVRHQIGQAVAKPRDLRGRPVPARGGQAGDGRLRHRARLMDPDAHRDHPLRAAAVAVSLEDRGLFDLPPQQRSRAADAEQQKKPDQQGVETLPRVHGRRPVWKTPRWDQSCPSMGRSPMKPAVKRCQAVLSGSWW